MDNLKDAIHEVVLVGGSARIPKVESMLHEFFNCKKLAKNINPDVAVAQGAAALCSGDKSTEVCSLIDLARKHACMGSCRPFSVSGS